MSLTKSLTNDYSMEDFCERFPCVSEKIFNSLEDQSLATCNESSRNLNSLLNDERILWIRIIKKYISSIQDFPMTWGRFLYKTPLEIVRKLAKTVVKFFKSNEKFWLYDSLSPLHISSNCGVLDLCQYIFEKTGKINPKTNDGLTPFHLAAREGHLTVCHYIIEKVTDKNPRDRGGRTPLHEAASSGNLEVCKLIICKFPNNPWY